MVDLLGHCKGREEGLDVKGMEGERVVGLQRHWEGRDGGSGKIR